MLVLVADKTPHTISRALWEAWLQWAPPPDTIVFDQGKEFSGEFIRLTEVLGAHPKPVPTETPWQKGMVERHGSVMGDVIAEGKVLRGYDEMKLACQMAGVAKNATMFLLPPSFFFSKYNISYDL